MMGPELLRQVKILCILPESVRVLLYACPAVREHQVVLASKDLEQMGGYSTFGQGLLFLFIV